MDDINLKDVLRALLQGWKIVVGLTAAVVVAALLYSCFFVRPVYKAYVEVEALPFFRQYGVASSSEEECLDRRLQGLYRGEDVIAVFEHPDTSIEVFHRLELEKEGLSADWLQESASITALEDPAGERLFFLVELRAPREPLAEEVLEAYLEVFEQRFKKDQVERMEKVSATVRSDITRAQAKVADRIQGFEEELSKIDPEEKVAGEGWGVVLEPYYEDLNRKLVEQVTEYIRLESEMREVERVSELGELVMASEGLICRGGDIMVDEIRRPGELIVAAAAVLGLLAGMVAACGRYFWREIYGNGQ